MNTPKQFDYSQSDFGKYRSIKSNSVVDHSKPKSILDFEEISLEETNRYLLKKLTIAREHFWNYVYYVKEDFSDFEIKVLNIVCENCDNVLANNEDFCLNCNKPAEEKKIAVNCAGKGKKKCYNCENYIPSRSTYCKFCKYDYKTNSILKELPVVKPSLNTKVKKKKKHVNIKINTVSNVDVLIENDKTLNNISLFHGTLNISSQKLFDESAKLAFKCIIQSKNELVKLNLNLVRNIAQKILYTKRNKVKHLKVEDLIQEGNIGLLKAIDKFDVNRTHTHTTDGEEKEISFSTYATYWITKEILKSIIVKDKIIRLPDHIINKYKNFQFFYFDYINKHLEAPTLETLIKELKLSKKNVEALLFAVNQTDYQSLDTNSDVYDSDVGENFIILHLFKLGLYQTDNHNVLNTIMYALDSIKFKKQSYKDAFIDMFCLCGKEYSLDEISEKYDISKVTLIKIRETTLEKLKDKINLEDW